MSSHLVAVAPSHTQKPQQQLSLAEKSTIPPQVVAGVTRATVLTLLR